VAPLQLLPAEATTPSPVELVFAAFLTGRQRILPGTRPPRLDVKRRKLILLRLREFSLADLEQAARGIWLSEWHLEVPASRISFEIVLRDAPHIERFRDIALRPELGKAAPSKSSTLQPPAKDGEFNWRKPGEYRGE